MRRMRHAAALAAFAALMLALPASLSASRPPAAAGVSGALPPTIAAASPADPARARAIARVRTILRKNTASCEMRVRSVSAVRTAKGWRVTARVTTFGYAGRAAWNVVGRRVAPADPLAADIENGCP